MNEIVGTADVYQDDEKVGQIVQGLQESVFAYDEAYRPRPLLGGGVAWLLPIDGGPFITRGKAQHTFFANLLPEGFRLEATRQRAGVARGDAFGLLLAVGADTVGDITVVPKGERPCRSLETPNLAESDFHELVKADLQKATSIQGVQDKISGYRLTFPVRSGGDAILKVDPADWPLLVQNEHFSMQMARACGLETAETEIVSDRTGRSGLLVRRFDRTAGGSKLHQEDGCQLLDIYPESKYDVSVKHIVEAVRRVVDSPPRETVSLLKLFVFAYLIGNADLHAKNVSVLLREDGIATLSPVYDMLSTLPYPKHDRNMALKMDGRDARLKRDRFWQAFHKFDVSPRSFNRALDRILDVAPAWIDRFGEVGYDEKTTERVQREMRLRREQLGSTP